MEKITMTKELKAKLNALSCFNKKLDKRSVAKLPQEKIFLHNSRMYSTDGYIMAVTDNVTGAEEFSYYKTDKKDFVYFAPDSQEVRETAEQTKEGRFLDRVIEQYDFFNLSFDLDFTDIPNPYRLMSLAPSNRYIENTVYIDVEKNEILFKFNGGLDNDTAGEGVEATYGDLVKNVKSDVKIITGDELKIKLPAWYIIEMLRKSKSDVLHFDVYTERKHATIKAGNFTFYTILRED